MKGSMMVRISVVAREKFHWSESGGRRGREEGVRIEASDEKTTSCPIDTCYMIPKTETRTTYTRTMPKTPPLRLSPIQPKPRSLSLESLRCKPLYVTMSHRRSRSDGVLTEPVLFDLLRALKRISMVLSALSRWPGVWYKTEDVSLSTI